tara:strand:+ start:231 stop:626 length:396 start_codon:yes stop_codon:yes gene_type:complete
MIEVKSESSGAFVPTFISPTATISAGASGSIITLTPPSGERARLTSLVSNRTDNVVTVSVGGVNVISKALGTDAANTNLFIIASGGSQTYLNSNNGLIREIMGGVNEQIIVIRSGLTSATIRYAYQFGVIK